MSFADLKKQSSLGSLTQKLVKEVEKQEILVAVVTTVSGNPEMDKTGNGYAVIRFLPTPMEISLGQDVLMPSKDWWLVH